MLFGNWVSETIILTEGKMRKVFILLACMAVMASAVAQADYEQVFRFEKEFKGFGG